MLCSSATELLHKQKLEGSWNTDNTTLSVTTFFYEGKTKCAPSSALDVRSGIDFDLRTNFVRTTSGDLKPALVLCLTKGKVILEQRDVSDLVLHGREIVDGASVCLPLPALSPRPIPPLLREWCRICHHICQLSATCLLDGRSRCRRSAAPRRSVPRRAAR